jgi:hypothetical protein
MSDEHGVETIEESGGGESYMNLYDVAKKVCHDSGLPYTDPRTGETTIPSTSTVRHKNMFNILTTQENQAVRSAIRGSIDLYTRYVTLRPEDAGMARKQGQKRRQLTLLKSAMLKLKD